MSAFHAVAHDDQIEFLVVVPSMGSPSILAPSLARLAAQCDGTRTRIVVSLNCAGEAAMHEALKVVSAVRPPPGVSLCATASPVPLGFAEACNVGLRRGMGDARKVPGTVVFLNDDAHVTAGWLRGLRAAIETDVIRLCGDGGAIPRPAAPHGRIGMVGPSSNEVAGMQRIDIKPEALAHGIDAFAFAHRRENVGNVIAVDFLSGFCLAVDRACLIDLLIDTPSGLGFFDSVAFKIGGFEDNDVCVRAELAGWRCAIAADVYVHHLGSQTLQNYPGQMRGLANRAAYYSKWRGYTSAPQRVVAAYRVRLDVEHDLRMFAASLARIADLVDGIAILLTSDPRDIAGDLAQMDGNDSRLIVDLRQPWGVGTEPRNPQVAFALTEWVKRAIGKPSDSTVSVRVEYVPSQVASSNERDERNAAIALAVEMGATWVWAVDHDEVVEDRVTRAHVDRILAHPDPMVRIWDFGWLNHWDSERLVRVDRPWGDGGSYSGGMRGFRLWRVSNPTHYRRIVAGTPNGLHCGNAPDHDILAKRVSGIRFRHLGYLRHEDRIRKHRRYTEVLDPNPDAFLTGGGYGHLIAEEGMQLSPFVAVDGIGLHMLAHDGEQPESIARQLDAYHGLVDDAVVVWTEDDPIGPGAVGSMIEFFGARVVHHPLDGHFAAARNAGIDAIAARADELGIGWAYFVDPDEYSQEAFAACVALRRMAECSDAWGWQIRFANQFVDGTASGSETIRMSRLHPAMRMDGRIHEGFADAIESLQANGVHPQIRVAPFMMINPGLAREPAELQRKLDRYADALYRELAERPWNSSAWVSLGLQRANDGDTDGAEECYRRGVLFSGQRYLAFRELGLLMARRAAGVLVQARDRLTPGSASRRGIEETLSALAHVAAPQKVIGIPRPRDELRPLPEIPEPILHAGIAAAERSRGGEGFAPALRAELAAIGIAYGTPLPGV